MCPALMWISPRASGTSRWITAGSSASPPLYATNAASTASMHADIGSAARTSASRRIRTAATREACRPGCLPVNHAGLSENTRPNYRGAMTIERFEMERYQSRYWHLVDYDLSESGVSPLTIAELLGSGASGFVDESVSYPLCGGARRAGTACRAWLT